MTGHERVEIVRQGCGEKTETTWNEASTLARSKLGPFLLDLHLTCSKCCGAVTVNVHNEKPRETVERLLRELGEKDPRVSENEDELTYHVSLANSFSLYDPNIPALADPEWVIRMGLVELYGKIMEAAEKRVRELNK